MIERLQSAGVSNLRELAHLCDLMGVQPLDVITAASPGRAEEDASAYNQKPLR